MDRNPTHIVEPLKSNLSKLPIIKNYNSESFLIDGHEYRNHITIDQNEVKPFFIHNKDIIEDLIFYLESIERRPEIFLLGLGKSLENPEFKIRSALSSRGVQPEIMSTESACRTWNILISENRNVVACLLLN